MLEDGDKIHSGLELYKNGAILTESTCERYSFEIKDKVKSNILAKVIAILQISRFLLEEINRAFNSLPISPLEYFTCAQVFAALFTYVYWLEKPHGVREKIMVEKGQERRIIAENRKVKSMLTTFTILIPTSINIRLFKRFANVLSRRVCCASDCSKRSVILECTVLEQRRTRTMEGCQHWVGSLSDSSSFCSLAGLGRCTRQNRLEVRSCYR